jgi:hypothetical protein
VKFKLPIIFGLFMLIAGCGDATTQSTKINNPENTKSPFTAIDLKPRACSENSLNAGRFTIKNSDPCNGNPDNHLLYIHGHRAMYVCENGLTVWANFVSGGRGGFIKQRKGDKKVPQGIYQLGTPRASGNYGIFIPIQYPNAEDLAAGRTGGSVGIHGPKRIYACDGSANLFTPWTDGCIAYPSDSHVYAIAQWLKKNPKAYIELKAQ